MDHNIGRLVDLLVELGVADNTLIVFVSDNGGCTMDEGAAGGRFPGNNGPFRGGKATTYQGGLNVPLLMNWKGRLPQGIVSDDQVMHCDIFATLLDAASIPVPEVNGKNPVRGTSLIPHMQSAGNRIVPERTMIFELWGNIGLRKGDYKLWSDIGREHSPDWGALVAELEHTDLALYDLGNDVAEKHDLRTERPEVYASLKKELIDHFSNINAEYPVAEAPRFRKTTRPSPRERLTPRRRNAGRKSSSSRVGTGTGRSDHTGGVYRQSKGSQCPRPDQAVQENRFQWRRQAAARRTQAANEVTTPRRPLPRP